MAEISLQEQFLAHACINGCKVRILIDNGSQITIINGATCERLGLTTKRLTRTQPVHVASGEHYHDSTHSCRAALKFSDAVTFTVTCLVLPVAADVILGNDWLRMHDATIKCKQDILSFCLDGRDHKIRRIKLHMTHEKNRMTTTTANVYTAPMTANMLENTIEQLVAANKKMSQIQAQSGNNAQAQQSTTTDIARSQLFVQMAAMIPPLQTKEGKKSLAVGQWLESANQMMNEAQATDH
ncbi:hypothetical protein COEREDRAFT_12718 [Coemansia reversa NRRL 1564]|uniref:Peptidase A2 domain-containing protein n=1 Tax=Coemansia reversa (strain ATCC 12441 / NRRL 1564) TaxID=763665 RepID=A0A2G5B0E4_COERN|nr:hypothetical protein COEREDRAFT_12718 [Coemansia reversa NRRL 1564]|eukprot:PIA12494.1 hypothetical protein COEREDRAFT_12718 [Coemansia reversa NRRL 1564]